MGKQAIPEYKYTKLAFEQIDEVRSQGLNSLSRQTSSLTYQSPCLEHHPIFIAICVAHSVNKRIVQRFFHEQHVETRRGNKDVKLTLEQLDGRYGEVHTLSPGPCTKAQQTSPNNEEIANQLEALLTPAIFAQEAYARQLGWRERILNLPLMVAVVLTLLWRQISGGQELNRLGAREDLVWCRATKVSQQALSQRFLALPSEKFIAGV